MGEVFSRIRARIINQTEHIVSVLVLQTVDGMHKMDKYIFLSHKKCKYKSEARKTGNTYRYRSYSETESVNAVLMR